VALWGACTQGHSDVVATLALAGADLEYFDDTGFSALLWAVESSEPECVRVLLENGADVNTQTATGATALIMAADLTSPEQDLRILRDLLSHGADVHLADSQHATALSFAAQAANVDAVELLLTAGAEVNVQDEEGSSPLLRVAEYGPPPGELDRSADGELDPTAKVAKLLIEKGADINLADLESETPLMLAVKQRNRSLVELLLESGADVSLTNLAGETAFTLGSKELASCMNETGQSVRENCEAVLELCKIMPKECAETEANGSNKQVRKIVVGAGLAKRKRRKQG